MFVKIPFESTIEFKTNIYEIAKMSLEHDFNVNDGVVLGNFYISGLYRTHEVSVNKEEFKYTLPFTVDLSDNIDKDTLDFNIEDFSYEIVGGNKLKVNIEYSLEAEEIQKEEEVSFERVSDEELEEELNNLDNMSELEEVKEIEEVKEVQEEKQEKKEEKEMPEERLSEKEEKTIMETIQNSDDTFVTYHVHIAKEGETMESICTLYNTQSNLIKEYNDIDTLSVGDKILIPFIDE